MSTVAGGWGSQYAGNGATTAFAFPFRFFQNTDIVVIQTIAGVDTGLVYLTHYSVTGAELPAGGTITFFTAPAVGTTISIYTTVPQTQPVDYIGSDNFPAETHEEALDRLTVMIKELNARVGRCVRVARTNSAGALEMPLNSRKNNVVGFDNNGNLTYYAISSGVILPQTVAGTANQVLVNGTVGTPTSGALTLTLPQNIDTTSTPQFKRLGINVAAGGNNDILITRSLPGLTAQASVVVQGILAPAPATDLHPNAFRDLTIFVPTQPADGYCSYDAQTSVGGTVALNHYRGFQVRNGYTGTNTLGEMTGYMTANFGLSGVGTITFLRSFYVSNASISGGGTVGQFDGIYMDQLSNATGLVNAIYIAGNNRVFMGGGQLVTSIDLTPPAGAPNARGAFTFDQATQTGLAIMNRNATATGRLVDFCRDGGSTTGWIQQVNNTTVAYNTTSDARLKENFERDIHDSGDIFDRLRPCIFDWREGGKDNHGFIAQELAEIYPAAVSLGDDELMPDGRPMHPWGYDASKLVPVMVAEIKSLRTRVAQLEAA